MAVRAGYRDQGHGAVFPSHAAQAEHKVGREAQQRQAYGEKRPRAGDLYREGVSYRDVATSRQRTATSPTIESPVWRLARPED